MRLDTLQLDLGVIGPAAGGEFVQNNFHRLIGVAPANGWANQLHNEPTLGLTFERRWRTGRGVVLEDPKLEYDIVPRIGGCARQRRDLWRRRRHRAHRQGPAQRFRPDARPAGAAGFGRLHRRRASAGTCSSASMAKQSPATSSSTATPTATACASRTGRSLARPRPASPLIYRGVRISYTQVLRTPEFFERDRFDQFGSINVTFRY